MAVSIRLRRFGRRNSPAYRIVMTDSRNAAKGNFNEILGYYLPVQKKFDLDKTRYDYWLSKGVKPSDTVGQLVVKYGK